MRKAEFIWLVVLLVVGGIYARYFTGWFDKKQLIIVPTLRPTRSHPPSWSVVFSFNSPHKIKSLQVVPLENGRYNPLEPPVWSLVADSNAVPVRNFAYGGRIKGMKLAEGVKKAKDLDPDLTYHLIVSADGLTGTTDFHTHRPN